MGGATLDLLYASPYLDSFAGVMREGKIHIIKESRGPTQWRTYCGKTDETCPGEIREGFAELVTCKGCIRQKRVSATVHMIA
jgi:hypothetical protein